MQNASVLVVVSQHINHCESALKHALAVTKQQSRPLIIVTALPEIHWPMSDHIALPSHNVVEQALIERSEKQVEQWFSEHSPDSVFTHHVCFGHAYLEAIKLSLSEPVSLIVKETKKPDWLDYLFDSDDMHLLRKSPTPVHLVHYLKPISPKKIIVALDFDHIESNAESVELNDTLLEQAALQAVQHNAELTILNVYSADMGGFVGMWADDPDAIERAVLEEERTLRYSAIQNLLESLKIATRFPNLVYRIELVHGAAGACIVQATKRLHTDLLVMGTVGRVGIQGLIIGNTAESVLLQIDCAVLALKPRGFITPVKT